MNVINFRINLTTAFSDAQLVRSGWKVKEKDKHYIREKGKYRFDYIIKSFGKIRVSEMTGYLNSEENLTYENMKGFDFEDAWKKLWNKSFVPESVEILMRNNILEKLIDKGWKPAVIGVIEYVTGDYNLSYYYPAPEGENLYKLVDDNPEDVLKLPQKLINLDIF